MSGRRSTTGTKVRTTATNRTAAEVNSTVLLETLRGAGPLTRTDLARQTGLSTATVTRLVDRLVGAGLLIEGGTASSRGGRPPRLVAFNAAAGSVLALDVGSTRVTGAVTDLEAHIVARRSLPTPSGGAHGGQDRFECVATLAATLIAEAAERGAPVRAIGVGVPGVVRGAGVVEFAPAVQWFDLPLQSLLEERFGVVARVENDVNLAAIAESRRGAAVGVEHALVVAVGTGIGAALLLQGRLYRGATGAAGEIGYTLREAASLATPWPGFGDLESRIGSAGMLQRYRGQESDQGLVDAATLVADARAGVEAATGLLDEVVDDLALAVGNASVLLDPELVVLAGGFGVAAADLLLPAVERRLQGRIPSVPRFAVAQVEDAGLHGAAELAIDASASGATLDAVTI